MTAALAGLFGGRRRRFVGTRVKVQVMPLSVGELETRKA